MERVRETPETAMPAANLTAKGETRSPEARSSREKHTPSEAFQRTRKQIVPKGRRAGEAQGVQGNVGNPINARRPLLPERAETIVDAPPGALEQPDGGRDNRSRRNAGGTRHDQHIGNPDRMPCPNLSGDSATSTTTSGASTRSTRSSWTRCSMISTRSLEAADRSSCTGEPTTFGHLKDEGRGAHTRRKPGTRGARRREQEKSRCDSDGQRRNGRRSSG